MDLLSQHEAFLRAIFDAPDDDTPRLVYADFLEENGEADRAEFIRVSCEYDRLMRTASTDEESERHRAAFVRKGELERDLWEADSHRFAEIGRYRRGFRYGTGHTRAAVAVLSSLEGARETAVAAHPEWFGALHLTLADGVINTPDQVRVLFESPALAKVRYLELQGEEKQTDAAGDGYFVHVPVITNSGVEALVRHRGVRRLSLLDLRNNNLDNDAARALVRSPYLDDLKRLLLLDGNRLRGKVWQQVVERFGEDVVG
ncbi:MAG: hypothetical protein C0501_12285 [Isosphaera sp.]|nr:hypothetical protein [Isosphaera sp.]